MLAHCFGWPLSYIGVRRSRQAGARPPARGGPARPGGRAARRSGRLGWSGGQCGRRTRRQPVAPGDHGAVRGDHGRSLDIGAVPDTRPGDVPLYISDCGALFERTDWRPRRDARQVLADIEAWISTNQAEVRAASGARLTEAAGRLESSDLGAGRDRLCRGGPSPFGAPAGRPRPPPTARPAR